MQYNNGKEKALKEMRNEYPSDITKEQFEIIRKELSGAEVEVVKRNELHTFTVLPKHWIVERSFGWLDKCRRLWKNAEKTSSKLFSNVLSRFYSYYFSRILNRL